MATKKHIYGIFLFTKYGTGMQPTKGDTKADARKRFQKRFPKKRIIEVGKLDPASKHYARFQNDAI